MSLNSREELPPELADRLPPGQHLTVKWPVLHYGSVPTIDMATWTFAVTGLVAQPIQYSWDEFLRLPRLTTHNDIHCVTRWSKLNNTWEGVSVRELLARAQPSPEATHVLVRAEQGYSTNLSLADFSREENLFVIKHDGEELEPDHGWPLRLVVPHLYFWKSAKWVRAIELLDHEEAGFWERNGYHMRGEPWAEERYSDWW